MKDRSLLKLLLLFPVAASALTLTEVTHKVIKTNPEYLETVKQFNAVRSELDKAYSGYLPRADIAAASGTEDVTSASTSFVEKEFDREELSFTVTQNIFNGFGDINEIDKQKLRLKSAAYKVLEQANEITLQATKTYIDVLREQGLLTIAQQNADIHKKYFQDVQKKTKAGFSDTSELNQVSSRLALANSALVNQKIAFANAKAKFYKVYAFDFDASSFTRPAPITGLPKSVQEAFDIAMENNPAIKVNYFDFQASGMGFKKARANFYPSIDVEYKVSDNENLSGVTGINDTQSLMLKLSYNLYRGGADSAEKQKTVSLMHQARQKTDITKRKVKQFLEEAWNSYTLTAEQLEFSKQHVDLSTATVKSYVKQFGLGRRNLLDLLIAEGERNGARQVYLNGEYDLLYAQYKLKNGVGELINQFDIKLAASLGLVNGDITLSEDDVIDSN